MLYIEKVCLHLELKKSAVNVFYPNILMSYNLFLEEFLRKSGLANEEVHEDFESMLAYEEKPRLTH